MLTILPTMGDTEEATGISPTPKSMNPPSRDKLKQVNKNKVIPKVNEINNCGCG